MADIVAVAPAEVEAQVPVDQLETEQPVEIEQHSVQIPEVQHIVPSFSYVAAPQYTFAAPPAYVSHYTWNGVQYSSFEEVCAAMREAPAAAQPEEKEEEKVEKVEEEAPKTRAVKPAKKGCC